jgi:hypothetical protein
MTLLTILIVVFLVALFVKRQWKSNRLEIDDRPLLPKWLLLLIWIGSIAAFQGLEFHRYLGGLSYRPFFGLYAGLIFAAVVWVALRGAADVSRQRQARLTE